MREQSYIVDHEQFNTDLDLSQYDAIFTPRFYQKIDVEQLRFTREGLDELTDHYSDYIQNGGSVMIFIDQPLFTNYENMPLLTKLGANFTGNDITKDHTKIVATNGKVHEELLHILGVK